MAEREGVQSPRPGAREKCALFRDLFNRASSLQASAAAHAVLAHLINDAWPGDQEGEWVCTTPIAALATRLRMKRETVSQAVRGSLDGLVEYQAGKGSRRSRFVLRASALARASDERATGTDDPGSPQGSGDPTPPAGVVGGSPTPPMGGIGNSTPRHPNAPVEGHGCPRRGSPNAPAGGHIPGSSSNSPPPPEAIEAGGGGGDALEGLDPEEFAARVRLLSERPSWVPAGQGWFSPADADLMARLPRATVEAIGAVLAHAREKRKELIGIAGWVRRRLERPEPGEMEALIRTRPRPPAVVAPTHHAAPPPVPVAGQPAFVAEGTYARAKAEAAERRRIGRAPEPAAEERFAGEPVWNPPGV
ncbi:MAG: hypothetical protein KF699_00560 [Phycisphaeraceae bacterium]|nr:hypothetical protein [Phycisphaeraceae bacterium]